jgi:hypothetical protein
MSWAGRQVRGCCRTLVQFWSKPVRAEPLAGFRIAIGMCLFGSISLSFLPRVSDFVGEDGLCPLVAAEPWFDRRETAEKRGDKDVLSANRICLLRGPQHVPYLEDQFSAEAKARWRAWGDNPDNVRLMTRVWLLAIVAMTVGLGTRFSTFVVWVMAISFCNRFSWIKNGGDDLARVALFYLLIAPAGKVWSVDAAIANWYRKRRGTQATGPVFIPAWSVRLAQIQICFVYFCTGAYKVWSDGWGRDWIDGTAVYWLLNDVALTRFSYTAIPIPLWICQVFSWGTIAFEIGFPFLVLCRWTRPLILIGGVLFHLGILVFTEVGWFSMVSVAWYPLFLKGTTLQRFRRWVFGPKNEKTN